MTTEEDFQKHLDLYPGDFHTRLVFADWLQERDDPRAEGYRALGALRLCPIGRAPADSWWWWTILPRSHVSQDPAYYFGNGPELPGDWFALVDIEPACDKFKPSSIVYGGDVGSLDVWKRRRVEDAAALAFGKLPEARKADILSDPELRGATR